MPSSKERARRFHRSAADIHVVPPEPEVVACEQSRVLPRLLLHRLPPLLLRQPHLLAAAVTAAAISAAEKLYGLCASIPSIGGRHKCGATRARGSGM